MKSSAQEKNIQRAQELHHILAKAGFAHGCMEVCLTAFGATFALEEIQTELQQRSLHEFIQSSGFVINWVVSTDQTVFAEDIDLLLKGKLPFHEHQPTGDVLGYLFSEHYPDKAGHMIAIFLNDNSYFVIDTSLPLSCLEMTAENLAHLANFIVSKGGSFEIVQIKKKI